MSRLFTLYRETLQWNAAGLGVTQGAVFAQATGLPFDDRQFQGGCSPFLPHPGSCIQLCFEGGAATTGGPCQREASGTVADESGCRERG